MANLIPLAIADVELQLATAISVGGTSFSLSSATDDDGNSIPAGMYCFTVDNGSTNKEYLLGQLNGTSVTGVYSVNRQGTASSGAVRAHRVGASAIITDFATIQRVADILRGQLDLDGTAPLSYDAEPTLSNREEIATVAYVLDTVNGGTVDFDNQVVTGVNAGETVAAGDLVYLNLADQEWYLADADSESEVIGVQLGIALGAGTDGAGITGGVQLSGVYTTSGLTAGNTYYASNTAGAYATTAGTYERAIGYSLSTTRLLLNFVEPTLPTAGQKAALAGGGGTPSSTNTYQTKYDSRFGVNQRTAGATINGATLPVPVYQNKTDNEFYACDANDTSAMKFLGFAISNGTDGNSIDIQFSGIVTGFTGLSEGEKYYVQDTAGTIGSTVGTNEILVGIAISETELLIQKGKRYKSGYLDHESTAIGATDPTITLGFRPSKISVTAIMEDSSTNWAISKGCWTIGGGEQCIGISSAVAPTDYATRVFHADAAGVGAYGVVTSVTDTTFVFNTSAIGSPGSGDQLYVFWEAEGEL